jgi:hypothetical protein
MRIHTSLTYGQMSGLTGPGQAFGGRPLFVVWHKLDTFKSRTHAYGYDITLEGSGGRNNTGLYGAGDYNGATWDEWGAVFGRLFTLDPAARAGGTVARPVYANSEHFHWTTGHRFSHEMTGGQLPADTHKRHRWAHDGYSPGRSYSVAHCEHSSGCTAIQRWLVSMSWDEFTYSTEVYPPTCILTGAEGENPDDCTTHDHTRTPVAAS